MSFTAACMFTSSFSNVWLTFQVKNNVKSVPLALHLLKSRNKVIMLAPQIVTYVAVENGMKYKGEQR